MNFQLKKFCFIFSFIVWSMSNAAVKNDVSSIIQILPTEITQKITKYLPDTEQEKMFLVSKQMFEQTYLLKKENRIRAFKNYLHYPYLSRFYREIIDAVPLIPMDTESDTLKTLLEQSDNKKTFYQLLLRETNPEYFDVKAWSDFFDLEISKSFKIENQSKEIIGRCRVISLKQNHQNLISAHDINKIILINLPDDIFDANEMLQGIIDIIDKPKNKVITGDKLRIIFKLGLTKKDRDAILTEMSKYDLDKMAIYYKNIISLGTNLFNELKTNDVFVKVIDRTFANFTGCCINEYKNAENNVDNEFPDWKPIQFESVPNNECNIYLSFNDAQAQVNFTEKNSRNTHQNVVLKPYGDYKKNMDEIEYLIDESYFDNSNPFPDFFKYLCDRNFGLYLSSNLYKMHLQWNLQYEVKAQNFSLIDCVNILKNYVLPYALLSDGYSFLDKIFEVMIEKIKGNQHLTTDLVNFFIPHVQSYGIDLNTYIYRRHSTFLTEIFAKLNLIRPRGEGYNLFDDLISPFLSQGVDPFFEVDEKTVLENFFEKQITPEYMFQDTKSDIFQSFLQNQTKTANNQDLFSFLTKEGNTILHSYFKYASAINMDIINTIINSKKLDINTRNKYGQTTFELFLNFIHRIRTFTKQKTIKLHSETQWVLNNVFDSFIKRGFNFDITIRNGVPLENFEQQYPELDWYKIKPQTLENYFKYASAIDRRVINAIMNEETLDINARNNHGETAFENFLAFIDRMRSSTPRNSFDENTKKSLNDIVDKFIDRGFNFNIKTRGNIPLRNLAPQYPELDWRKIELRIPSEKKSRW